MFVICQRTNEILAGVAGWEGAGDKTESQQAEIRRVMLGVTGSPGYGYSH